MRNHRPPMNARASKQYAADPAMMRTIGVVALLAVGTIHFLQIVPTVQQTPLLGLGYIALIMASVIVAGWLTVANDACAWAAAGLISAAVLVGYAFTRFVGTTFDNQDVGNWACMLGLASIFVETALLALSGAALALNRAEASAPSHVVRSRASRDGKAGFGIDGAELAELEISARQ
jgi:hypothetical protein